MNANEQLHNLRAECRDVLQKVPPYKLNDFEEMTIKTLFSIEAQLRRLSDTLKKELPEPAEVGVGR